MSSGAGATTAAVPVDKEQRQRQLTALLQEEDLTSQEEVIAGLARRGVETTQATVSRDLAELGAVKVRGSEGRLVYRLSPDVAHDDTRLVEVLRTFVTAVDVSRNLVVIRTPPAGAGPVASAIDLSQVPGALATIAGDDTVLVVADETTEGRRLADELRQMAGLS